MLADAANGALPMLADAANGALPQLQMCFLSEYEHIP